jgi:hypothetical protein
MEHISVSCKVHFHMSLLKGDDKIVIYTLSGSHDPGLGIFGKISFLTLQLPSHITNPLYILNTRDFLQSQVVL